MNKLNEKKTTIIRRPVREIDSCSTVSGNQSRDVFYWSTGSGPGRVELWFRFVNNTIVPISFVLPDNLYFRTKKNPKSIANFSYAVSLFNFQRPSVPVIKRDFFIFFFYVRCLTKRIRIKCVGTYTLNYLQITYIYYFFFFHTN